MKYATEMFEMTNQVVYKLVFRYNSIIVLYYLVSPKR